MQAQEAPRGLLMQQPLIIEREVIQLLEAMPQHTVKAKFDG